MELRERDPGDILAIPLPGHGWAYAGDLTKLYRAWTGNRIEELDTAMLARLNGTVGAERDL